MTKREFLDELAAKLKHLPAQEREERVAFCSEMIDDRMEEGLSEAEAVDAICRDEGFNAREEEAVSEASVLEEAVPEEAAPSPKKRKGWETVLIICGMPLWLSLLVAAFSVVVSLYASLWAVIVSLWSVFAALVGSAFGGIVGGIGFAIGGFGLTGLASIGAGLAAAGLSVFCFMGCRQLTRGALWLTKRPFVKNKKKGVSV